MNESSFKDRYGADACPRCGAREVIPDAWLEPQGMGGGDTMRILAYGCPDAQVFKKRVRSKVRVRVCARCGHIDLYATDLERLRDAHQERQARDPLGS